MTEPPISWQLVSFMALPATIQVEMFSEDLPTWRSHPTGPLCKLSNALQFAPYFFDNFPSPEADPLLAELKLALAAVSLKDSREDFLSGAEWEQLRGIARRMLKASSVDPCLLPQRVPLDRWVCDHFKH